VATPPEHTATTPSYDLSAGVVRSLPLQRIFPGARPTDRTPTTTPAPAATDAGAAGAAGEVTTLTWQPPTPPVPTTVQRAEASDTEGPSTADEPPAGATAPAASASGVAAALGSTSPPAGKVGGPDLDELARRLYGPVSAMLRAELWLDRERCGRSLVR
jgi:hypothetical protein